MEILFVAVMLGLIPAAIARSKGRSFGGWWLYGALIFIVALPHAILARPLDEGIARQQVEFGNRKCPHCAEWIKREAKVCRYCGRDVEQNAASPVNSR